MDIGVISVRYARALLKSALEQGIEEVIYKDMLVLTNSYITTPALKSTLDNPMLSKKKKEELLMIASGMPSTGLTKRFFQLVLQEGREKMLQFMASSYITLYRRQKNIITGKLITATTVSAETEQRMKQMVESRAQGTVEFQTEVDPDIIGGFILEYDSYRMDASVQRKLKTILNELKK